MHGVWVERKCAMTYYGEDIVDEIKRRVDIVDLVGSYVPLKKRGKNYVGSCPFHTEKTPSFTVSPEKQFFHCFGCGAGGDVFGFVMKRENLNFAEAVEFLASRAGVSLARSEEDKRWASRRKELLGINAQVARYYLDLGGQARAAQEFFRRRGLSSKDVRRYGLGYADERWDSLCKAMKQKGISEQDLLELDVISRRKDGQGYYDRFRHRIIFPIINFRGEVLGFGGRILDEGQPKYLNSSDTPVYKKGRELYGLYQVNKSSSRKSLILVEGYMDVISLASYGFTQVAASLGTALTEKQAKLAHRYGETVYLCYDSDDAGINATRRAIEICQQAQVPVKVIALRDGLDPDDFIRQNGKEAFAEEIKKAMTPVEYLIALEMVKHRKEGGDPTVLLQAIAHHIGQVPSPVEREVLTRRYAEELAFSSQALGAEVALHVNQQKTEINVRPPAQTRKRGKLQQYSQQWALLNSFMEDPVLARECLDDMEEDVVLTHDGLKLWYRQFVHALEAGWEDQDRLSRELKALCDEVIGEEEAPRGPVGKDEMMDWIRRLTQEGWLARRDALLMEMAQVDRGERDVSEAARILQELAQVNQAMAKRESDMDEG